MGEAMKGTGRASRRHFALIGAAVIALAGADIAGAQVAEQTRIDIPAQDLATALTSFGRQTRTEIVFSPSLVASKRAKPIKGRMTKAKALDRLLTGTGLTYEIGANGVVIVKPKRGGGATPPGAARPQYDMSVDQAERGQGYPVTGVVVDAVTGAYLKGAIVRIAESRQVAVTDDLGRYRFATVRPGRYHISVSYLGYANEEALLPVDRSPPGERNFALNSGNTEIVVIGQRSARAQALNQERSADNTSTVISGDLLGSFTGTTVSESLRRAPGVIFDRDGLTGDGSNIVIRGLTSELNTVTLNGVELPDTTGAGRSSNLGNILTDSISKITINKTLLPSQDSSGTGGLVEIETKTPLDRPRRYMSLTAEGAKRARGFNDEFLLSGTVSAKFGADDRFGLSASVQYREKSLHQTGYNLALQYGLYLPLQVDGTPTIFSTSGVDPRTAFPFEDGPRASDVYPVGLSITQTDVDTSNLNVTLSAAWEVDSHTRLFLDYQRLDRTDTAYSLGWNLRPSVFYGSAPVAALGGEQRQVLQWPNRSTSVTASFNYRPDSRNVTDVVSFRGETDAGKWHFGYKAGYTSGRMSQDTYTLNANMSVALPANALLASATDPTEGRVISPFAVRLPGDRGFPLPLLTDAGFATLNDASRYNFGFGQFGEFTGKNDRYTGEVTARYEFENSFVKYLEAGASYERSTFQNANPLNIQYSGVGFPSPTIASFGLGFSEASLSDVGIDTRLNLISRADVLQFMTSGLPGLAVECAPFGGGSPCPPGTRVAASRLLPDPKRLQERTREAEIAAYIQGKLQFGKLDIVGGVRMSRVDVGTATLFGPEIYDVNFQPDVAFFNANSALIRQSAVQTDWLPRIMANYRLGQNSVIRAGYFLSVARPQIALIALPPSVLLQQAPFGGPNFNQPVLLVQKGNPALRPAKTHNLDLSLEHYDRDIGVIKLGLFYKRIEDLLETNVRSGSATLEEIADLLPADPRFQDVIANPDDYFLSISQPVNNGRAAEIWGVEATVERQLTFLPGLLSGLGIYANYTYSDSSKDELVTWSSSPVIGPGGAVTGTETLDIVIPDVAFAGQAKHSGTIGLTYSKNGFEANLAYTMQSRRLTSYAPNDLGSYDEPYRTLDLRAEYRFGKSFRNVRVYVEGTDLLHGPSDPTSEVSIGSGNGDVGKYYAGAKYFGGREVRAGISVSF